MQGCDAACEGMHGLHWVHPSASKRKGVPGHVNRVRGALLQADRNAVPSCPKTGPSALFAHPRVGWRVEDFGGALSCPDEDGVRQCAAYDAWSACLVCHRCPVAPTRGPRISESTRITPRAIDRHGLR